MAGGKETPRQKMIGMMYLVLTALLALQVSNAVLEKFIFINGTLVQLVHETADKNEKLLVQIDQTAKDKGSTPEKMAVLSKAEEVRKLTLGLVESMDVLKEKMIEITGGREDGNPNKLKGAKDYDKVGSMMLYQGAGKKLEDDLDNYVKTLNDLVEGDPKIKEKFGGTFPLGELTKDASEIDVFADDPDQKNKGFLEITFMNTPTAAGLASVSQLQAEVLEYEARVLDAMAKAVDAAFIDFNIIVPMVKPRSEIVALGDKYEADLFITASAEGIDPVMKINGNEIPVEINPQNNIKMGKVSIPATSEGEKSVTATIEMNDSTFTEVVNYTVIRPPIEVKSAGLNALYRDCANPLTITVPLLGAQYNPTFSVTNGKSRKGQGPNVQIIPTSRRKVRINVRSGGFSGSLEFDTKGVPAPSVRLLAGNTPVGESVSAAAASNLVVQVQAEENFARECPDDRVYLVQEGRVLISGSAPRPFRGPRITIPRSALSPGKIIVVRLDKVARRRYDGSLEPVPSAQLPSYSVSLR